MTFPGRQHSGRDAAERRVDPLTADIVQIGVYFFEVYGKDNAEGFFMTTDIAPAVYLRIINGRPRRSPPRAGPEPEYVPA